MKQKKTMKLWQMILIMILSVAMLATMFLPAFRINGDAVVELAKKTAENAAEKDGSHALDIMNQYDWEKGAANGDEAIHDYEQENDIKVTQISAFQIMTKSIEKFCGKDVTITEEEQTTEAEESQSYIRKKYNFFRVMLWIVYGLVLVVLIMTLLGFLLKMNKYIPLTISTLYSLFAAMLFGYLRFMLLKDIGKAQGDRIATWLFSGFEGIDLSIMAEEVYKGMSAFYSFAFLVAFIIAILMLIASIVSMLVGNSAESEWEYDDEEEPSESLVNNITSAGQQGMMQQVHNISGEQHYFGGGESVYSGPTETVKQEPPKQKKAVRQPMGQVRCTKGDAVGMGYALPQDRKVIVGKSPQNANLVINNQNVSNIHCSIRYDATTNMYLVKDHSMNGTFVNGSRLQKDVMLQFPAGTVLSLADGSNQITLG